VIRSLIFLPLMKSSAVSLLCMLLKGCDVPKRNEHVMDYLDFGSPE
jgi:hypothetical protein